MNATTSAAVTNTPRWKRITQYPLVAMVIAIALFVGAGVVAKLIADQIDFPEGDGRTIGRSVITLACTFAVYKLAIRHLYEPHDDLPLAGAPKGLALGLLFGLILFSMIVGVAALFDVYNIVGAGGTSELVTAIFAMAIMPGVMEELLVRGILFRWLEAFGGSWFALALTSALFGLGHIFNPGATAFSSFAIALEAGVLLGGAYMLTRNLWLAMGLHAAWNFTQGEIFDVNVSGNDVHGLVTAQMSGPEILSGGSFGLEASLIALVLATAAGVWLVVLAVRRGQVMRPLWVRHRLTADPASVEAVLAGENRHAALAETSAASM